MAREQVLGYPHGPVRHWAGGLASPPPPAPHPLSWATPLPLSEGQQ